MDYNDLLVEYNKAKLELEKYEREVYNPTDTQNNIKRNSISRYKREVKRNKKVVTKLLVNLLAHIGCISGSLLIFPLSSMNEVYIFIALMATLFLNVSASVQILDNRDTIDFFNGENKDLKIKEDSIEKLEQAKIDMACKYNFVKERHKELDDRVNNYKKLLNKNNCYSNVTEQNDNMELKLKM